MMLCDGIVPEWEGPPADIVLAQRHDTQARRRRGIRILRPTPPPAAITIVSIPRRRLRRLYRH